MMTPTSSLRRLLPLGLAPLALLVVTSAHAQLGPDTPVEDPTPVPTDPSGIPAEQLETARILLSGFHEIAPADQFVAQLGDPVAVLWSIVRLESDNAFLQDRALFALAYWPGEDLRAYLGDLIPAGAAPREMLRHHAISLMARAFGEQELPRLAPLLQDADVQIRLTAVDAIATIGTPAALEALRTARSTETHRVVSAELDAVLSR
jgi:hypothetical protein